jgi:hypothetical protein
MNNESLLKFPASLPKPLLSSHELKQESNLLRTKMDSGHSRSRRRFKSVPTVMAATWHCRSEQAAAFEGFITHALHDCTAWFLLDILTPSGLIAHEVRFITSPLEECKPLSLTHWEYKAKIEINQRKIISEEQTADALLNPNNSTQFINGVNDAVDSYQE